jgi:HAMP domain-containing protein
MNKNNDETTTIKSTIFNQMKIGVRVSLSFFVILTIFIATSIFNLNSFTQHESSFSYYSKVNSDTIKIFEIDRQVSELQRIILIYSNTGNTGIIRRAKKTHQTLINSLNEIQTSIGHQENLSISNQKSLTLLNSMKKELEDYGENINTLVESREQRDRLIDESMQSLANDSLTIITDLKKAAKKDSNADIIKSIYSISDRLLTAQVNAVSFFANRQYKLKSKANESLKQAKENTIKLQNNKETSDELKTLTTKLINNISAYEQIFHQTLQATRDYLSLINVVMAGEATEFTTQSKNLKNSTLSTLELLTELTNQQLDSAQKITYFVTAIAITIGFALAFLTSQSLSRPIRAIADTFEQLVSGDHNTEIPGLNRGDEIGQLAIAANVFKAMNERTEKILEKSQALAGELQQREKQLEVQTTALQKSNDELDNFAYIASHDLKSPLRAIDNLSKWVQEDCADLLPEESRDHLTKMQERIQRMEGLLSDLLNYSRVGRVDVAVEKVNVAILVENAVEIVN